MQFTPQQLAGAQRYMSKTRVGNWLEDMCLEEEKLSEFAKAQGNGTLIMNDIYAKQDLYGTPVPLSQPDGGVVRFGDKVMLGHPSTGAVLACDLTESLFESDQASRLVTAALPKGRLVPAARSVFVVVPVERDGAAAGDVLHFGQSFHLQCHDILVADAAMGATKPGFYLASTLKNDRNGSRIANQQAVFMTQSKSMSAAWTFQKIAANTGIVRQLSCGEGVVAGDSLEGPTVVLQHRTTKQALAASMKFWDSTDFGRELEVSCHNYFGTRKVDCMGSEMAGRTTGATNARLEKSPNFWTAPSDAPDLPEPELPPKITPAGVVGLAAEHIRSTEGAPEALDALAAAAPGAVLDREDLAYELRDLGLKFDKPTMETLLDEFDTNKDGMIPVNAFMDAMLS